MVGERIKYFRKVRGLSQEELGRVAGGYTRSEVCRLEKGERMLKADRLVDFAKALKCSPIDLLKGD